MPPSTSVRAIFKTTFLESWLSLSFSVWAGFNGDRGGHSFTFRKWALPPSCLLTGGSAEFLSRTTDQVGRGGRRSAGGVVRQTSGSRTSGAAAAPSATRPCENSYLRSRFSQGWRSNFLSPPRGERSPGMRRDAPRIMPAAAAGPPARVYGSPHSCDITFLIPRVAGRGVCSVYLLWGFALFH